MNEKKLPCDNISEENCCITVTSVSIDGTSFQILLANQMSSLFQKRKKKKIIEVIEYFLLFPLIYIELCFKDFLFFLEKDPVLFHSNE
jgi:hypothetical protein